ncbi:Ribonuclease D [Rickettsiales endosymbiont of Paramecium tredecaurelia]|uniref:HRDC domain-containing protein n=1 Tax=Candidatus Sarmatiella mevalonica TaxID=2770581 RepID=UPI0019225DEF|nr:HRDC domain-containing protein [Candidatus Sarmatiella mevalonica]MBL3284371.1 Ribonuclease D [Candidatus Sarmatiella mevalonica]
MLISNQSTFEEICANINTVVSVDTEFERKTTYFPTLSTIQLCFMHDDARHTFVIDALAITNFTCFAAILTNPKITKVLHAAKEDLSALYRSTQSNTKNVFDTQVAAHVCGLGLEASYSDLCLDLLGVSIDKTYQRLNWLRRPLAQKMISYAADDAFYLYDLYLLLNDKLLNINKKSEFDLLMHKYYHNYHQKLYDPDNAWKKVKIKYRSPIMLYRMKHLAAWREECARYLNIPIKHCMNDYDLNKVCHTLPTSMQELKKLRPSGLRFINSVFEEKLFSLSRALRLQQA